MKTKIYLNILAVGMLAFMGSCASDEPIERGNGTDGGSSSALTSFSSVSPNRLMKYTPRTSMGGHDYLAGSRFYWEPGDNIYVKDDNNALQKSSMSNISATQPRARFKVPGAYTAQNTYEVYYTGAAAGATSDKVVISTTQTQTAPNTAKHIGGVGDCGTSTATRVGDHFEFMLDHKAAYLCFLPRVTNAELGKNVFLTKIVVKSDNAIAGDYTLSMAGLSSAPTANAATEITLTTLGTGIVNGPWYESSNSYVQVPTPGFPLSNTITKLATNAAYMVIAPGTHSLTVDYYIKDPVTQVEGAITKTLPVNQLFEANKVYDITANLTPTEYDDKYYMWDSPQHYWQGYEQYQPKVYRQKDLTHYPKVSTDPRWFTPRLAPDYAHNSHMMYCPNVNSILWYIKNGDPHWDNKTLWSTMGHLYCKGIWMKKSTNIPGYDWEKAPDGQDWRIMRNPTVVGNLSNVPLTDSEKDSYFYLPCLGRYMHGELLVGDYGLYWSNTAGLADPTADGGYWFPSLYFYENYITLHYDNGTRAQRIWRENMVPTK